MARGESSGENPGGAWGPPPRRGPGAPRGEHKALEAPFDVKEIEVRLGASVGIALSGAGAVRQADLVRFSDMAMLRGQAGRRRP